MIKLLARISLLGSFYFLSLHCFASDQQIFTQISNASEDSLIITIENVKKNIEQNQLKFNGDIVIKCGLSCYQRGKLNDAKDFFQIAQTYYSQNNDTLNIAKTTSNIAVIYEIQGNYDRAIETHFKALDIFTKLNDKKSIARSLNNIGVVYQEMSNTNKALSYYHQALSIKKQLNDTVGVASSLNNLGVLYEENQNNADSALHYYTHSLTLYKSLKDKKNQAKLLSNIAAIYVGNKNYKQAIYLLEEGKKLAIETNQNITLCNIIKNLAITHLAWGNLEETKKLIDQGLPMSYKYNYLKNQIEFLEIKAQYFERTNNLKSCIETHKQFQLLKDSLLNKEKNDAISKYEIMYDTKNREYKQAISEQALQLSKTELYRKNLLLWAYIIGSVLIAIIIFLLNIKTHKKNKYQRIMLENKMLRSQLSPHFMFNALGAIQNFMLENNNKDSMAYLIKFSRLMRNILDSSRADEISIENEIQILSDYLNLQQLRLDNKFEYTIEIDNTIETEDTFIPPMLLQPFLENAIEHGMKHLPESHKGQISLNIKQTNNCITLKVCDNGIGNSTISESKHISHAQNITTERITAINKAKKYNIRLTINNQKEQGYHVELNIKSQL